MLSQFIAQFFLFLFAAGIVVLINRTFTDSSVSLRILAVLLVLFLIFLRQKRVGFHSVMTNPKTQAIFLFFIVFFLLLLVSATGGFFSPFFILIHLVSLGFAFLFAFRTAILFLISAVTAMLFNVYFLWEAGIVAQDVPLLVVYLVSLGVIIPFSAMVASRYHLKGETLDYLFKQFFISRTEELVILGNIEEGIITLDRRFSITRLNEIAQTLTGYKEDELSEHNFFSMFTFKDKDGALVGKSNFPMERLLSTQMTFREGLLSMSKKDGSFFNVDFKISSILGVSGGVEGLLFIFRDLTGMYEFAEKDLIVQADFYRFFDHLGSFRSKIFNLRRTSQSALAQGDWEEIEHGIDTIVRSSHHLFRLYEITSGVSGLLDIVDAGSIVRNVFDQSNGLAGELSVAMRFMPEERVGLSVKKEMEEFVKLQPVSSKHVVQNGSFFQSFPVYANEIVLEQAMHELMEFSILVAATQNKPLLLIDTFMQDNTLLITLTFACKDFPWESKDQIFKPFLGTLQKHSLFAKAEGLESYLAYSLFVHLGAKVDIQKTNDEKLGDQVVITVRLPHAAMKPGQILYSKYENPRS